MRVAQVMLTHRESSIKGEKTRHFFSFFIMKAEQFVRRVLYPSEDADDTSRFWATLTLNALLEYQDRFEAIANLIDTENVKNEYVRIIERMFSDGILSRGRLVATFALASLLQERFDVDLVSETVAVVKDRLFEWMLFELLNHVW